MKNQVIILDFGGQYTQLIARCVRDEKVYCQVLSGDATVSELKKTVDPVQGDIPAAIIFSGGPDSVYAPDAVLPDKAIFELGVPILEAVHDEDTIRNFLLEVARVKPDWTMSRFIDSSVAEVRAAVGDGKVISGVSGGVDSTVATALVHEAVGDNLHCVLVDHGLLRKDEAKHVVRSLATLGIKVSLVNAQERFLNALKGVTDPEKKRKIIGEEFIRVFEEEARKIGDVRYFVQGTIYPDVIESGSRLRAVIKSHHNVGGLPERMNLKLVEPIRELFKDEVRLVGREMGIPSELIDRHPFPGPGMAVRVLGEVTRDKLDIVREAQAILDEEIQAAGLYDKLWQVFCVLPGVRTVGVMGDKRTFGHLVAVRAVESEDAMTATWARLPYEVLERVSSRIVNEVQDVNRVALDITSKPPSTIEWE